MKRKSRQIKLDEYQEKYSHIPKDYNERLSWMYDNMNISEKKAAEIYDKRNMMVNSLYYKEFLVVLYEEPEGAKRPRFRLINRKNLASQAMANSEFVHVYSPDAKEDNVYMKRLVGSELLELDNFICTPCIVEYNTYHKTPSVYNTVDTFLAEIGLMRPMNKPDWDNIGKKYSDMYNGNVWIDDACVVTGIVNKFYSILPRVEIRLRYLNMVYNKYQYNSMIKKIDGDLDYFKYEK